LANQEIYLKDNNQAWLLQPDGSYLAQTHKANDYIQAQSIILKDFQD
jgi:hypothetical protein